MQNNRHMAWMCMWFLVYAALWIWYMFGGPNQIMPATFAVALVMIGPPILRAAWLARLLYAGMWIFTGWFLWKAFH
jgi:hypothetical protein